MCISIVKNTTLYKILTGIFTRFASPLALHTYSLEQMYKFKHEEEKEDERRNGIKERTDVTTKCTYHFLCSFYFFFVFSWTVRKKEGVGVRVRHTQKERHRRIKKRLVRWMSAHKSFAKTENLYREYTFA